ncbi:MAG: methyl-accepting chemotaxis protein [Clostridiales Family XIII bacterium]|jgi:methyl-accepting chemotaxis protein|nr:methyl-accepting chemotaxis protein [Clostridiales Family XIII bacterium]
MAKGGRTRKLRTSILLLMTALVVAVTAALSATSAYRAYRQSMDFIDQLIRNDGDSYASAIDNYLVNISEDVTAIAVSGILTSAEIPFDVRQDAFDSILENRPDVSSVYTVGADGIAVQDADVEDVGEDYSKEEFFIDGMAADDVFISPPVYDEWTQNVTMTVTYKLKDVNGFDGLVCFDIHYDVIQELIAQGNLGESGYSFLLDEYGYFLAHPDEDYVLDGANILDVTEDESVRAVYEDLLTVTRENAQSPDEEGAYIEGAFVSINGGDRIYYTVIPQTGWRYFSVVKPEEFLGGFYRQLTINVGTSVALILLAVLIALVLSRRIANPISLMTKRMEMFAGGDLHAPMPQIRAANEIGVLYDSMRQSIETQNAYIQDMSARLTRIAEGDLRSGSTLSYVGDYVALQLSMEQIQQSMNQILTSIQFSSHTVDGTAGVLAARGKELSDNAVAHARTIDEIDAGFKDIRGNLRDTAENTTRTLHKTSEARAALEATKTDMDAMRAAMQDITEAASVIRSIIQAIDEIAFQTNILSLNAAVEAARAGAHGRGFAVVADEVRSLAGKSADSAQQTERLISNALAAVEKGTALAEQSWKQITSMEEMITEVERLVSGIEGMAASQAASADDIYEGIARLNSITQRDSAMSEESATASEELSAMAGELNRQVSYFKLEEADETVLQNLIDNK